MKIGDVDYSVEAAKSMTKTEWVKAHEHHGATGEQYDQLVGKPKKEVVKEKE